MMPPDPQQIEEWLSGLLDGELSEQEQRALELAMQNDPSIAQRLEEMTNLRRYLLQGRPVGRLGTDFSKRVVQAARRQASEMNAPPAWILPDAPNAVAPRSQEPEWSDTYDEADRPFPESIDIPSSSVQRRSQGYSSAEPKAVIRGLLGASQEDTAISVQERFIRVWLPTVAVVLALCAVIVFLPRNGDNNLTQPGPIASSDSDTPESAVKPDPSVEAVLPTDLSDSNPTLADVAPPKPMAANEVPPALAEATSDPSTDPLKQLPPPGPDGKYNITLIAQISVDPQATESQMLQELLEKHEIIASSDILLENNQLETLVGSKIVKGPVLDPASDSTKSSMYLIKSNAKRIDGLLRDVEAQYQDFPTYRLDVSFDPEVHRLMDHLAGVTESQDSARKMRLGSSQDIFEHELKGMNVDAQARKARKSGQSLADKLLHGENSFIILLVRPAQ